MSLTLVGNVFKKRRVSPLKIYDGDGMTGRDQKKPSGSETPTQET